MSRVLVIDDDADQLDIRKLILEHAGHDVSIASNEMEALAAFDTSNPEIVLVDLRLQRDGAGLDLIREFRTRSSTVRIVVLSGWPHDLAGRVEAAMVDAVVPKPAQSQRLLGTLARLAVLVLMAAIPAFSQSFDFTVPATGEITARLNLSAPGSDWSKAGSEAALADVRIDNGPAFNVMVFTDQDYPVFLGKLPPGRHKLSIARNSGNLKVNGATFEATTDEVILRGPVLYARANTIGKFTDVPLLVYAEDDGDFLQYTVIFSNEDGGTSTRALMARWGRTTDIEYVYRLNKRTGVAIIQSQNHKDIEYSGKLEGLHPVLMPITDNNMVGPVVDPPPVRYQITPIKVDLRSATREEVMAQHPFIYRIAAQELLREGKLREFGKVDGEKISDPRNYLYVDAKVANHSAGLSVTVRLKDDPIWRSADLGRADYAISRDGWVQTTIELPPGTKSDQITEIGLQCVVSPGPGPERRMPQSGDCRVEQIQKAFMLDEAYKPGKSIWSLDKSVDIPTGQMPTYKLHQ